MFVSLVGCAKIAGTSYGTEIQRHECGALTTGFVYDNENRLTKQTDPDGTVTTMTYQGYDGLRRSKQVTGSSPTTFIWDGSDYLGEVR